MAKKTIITVATTGAWPKKENNPNVPMTPREIAEDVYDCWQAGAAVAHLHMRDDEGNGTMDKAKFAETVRLLRTTDDTVLAVAQDCGFRSLASFNKLFKKITGVVPSALRKPA